MTLLDKIRATTSFGLVEVADSLYADGRAYSKVSLTEILGLKFPVSNSYLLTGEEAVQEDAGNVHYNNPQLALTRTTFISSNANAVSSGDSTLSLCGKSYGTVNVAYDTTNNYFYQIIKSKGTASTAKSTLIRFSKNPAEPTYKGWELSRSTAVGTTNGTMDMLNPDFGSIDIFLKSMSNDVCMSLYTSIAQNPKPSSGTYANSGLNKFSLNSIGPSQYWIDTFTATNICQANSVTVDKRGYVYFVAHTVIGSNNSELVITRTDQYGNLIWQKTLGGTTNEYGYAIHADKDDNIYVAGATSTGAGGTTEAFLAKLTTDGAVTWQKTFGSAQSDVGYALTSDSSGNVYLAGTALASFAETDAVSGQLFVAKVSSSGTITWQKTLSTATAQAAKAIAVDSSGNVYVAGYVDITKNGSQSAYVLKLNSTGTYVWDKRITNVAQSAFYGLALDSSGDLLAIGKTVGSQSMTTESGDILITESGDLLSTETGSKSDIYLAKITSVGVLSWQQALYDNAKSCTGYKIVSDGSGGFYLTATASDASSLVYVAKIDGSGVVAWQNSLTSNGTDKAGSVCLSPTSELMVLSTKTGSNQVVLAKLPIDGTSTGTYGSFTYQTKTLLNYVPESVIADATETGASTTISNFLTAATPTLSLGTASLTVAQTSVSSAGSTIDSLQRSTGWLQAVYLDSDNQNPWAVFASTPLYDASTNGTPVFAVNRTTGVKQSLGNLHSSTDGLLGCFVSNAEPLTAITSTSGSVVFYGVKMTAAGLSVQCATVNVGATPSMVSEACTLSGASSVVGFDPVADSSTPPESRRVRPFLMKDGTAFVLGVAVYDVAGKTRTPSPYKIYVFNITNKTSLALVQTLDISGNGVPVAAMPVSDTQKRWLVAYGTKISVYKWRSGTNFAKIDETDCANLSWIGVDSRQRIWFTNTDTAAGLGKQLNYYEINENAVAPTAKAVIALEFDKTRYYYDGTNAVAKLSIRYYAPNGDQTAKKVIINIFSDNARFEDNSFTKTTTTSSSQDTVVPIVIKGPGYIDLSVSSAT